MDEFLWSTLWDSMLEVSGWDVFDNERFLEVGEDCCVDAIDTALTPTNSRDCLPIFDTGFVAQHFDI